AFALRHRVEVVDEQGGRPVYGEHLQAWPVQDRWCRVQRVDHRTQGGTDARRAVGGGVSGRLDQVGQVASLQIVQPQRSGDGVEHLVGDVGGPPLLEPRVI